MRGAPLIPPNQKLEIEATKLSDGETLIKYWTLAKKVAHAWGHELLLGNFR
jgi:hypothetical protein